MQEAKTAIFFIEFEARHVVGRVEIRGVPDGDASFLRMDGFVCTPNGWMLTVRKGLKKRWEDRVASALIGELWGQVNFYGITCWRAGNDEAYQAAEPDLRSQMRHIGHESW
ncbi:hypothetical protein V3W47_03115 [Deinococcus sp. YIM 134068]|uniref:hypothetical protein n=1 Tax=Deinococcus lichenicola TaxID=3118910 RepID=UPI002F956C06